MATVWELIVKANLICSRQKNCLEQIFLLYDGVLKICYYKGNMYNSSLAFASLEQWGFCFTPSFLQLCAQSFETQIYQISTISLSQDSQDVTGPSPSPAPQKGLAKWPWQLRCVRPAIHEGPLLLNHHQLQASCTIQATRHTLPPMLTNPSLG